jgi:uncharacterized protein (DUF427 family)
LEEIAMTWQNGILLADSEEPRLVIELEREDQQYFTYEALKCFDDIPQAREYAQEHEISDVEY